MLEDDISLIGGKADFHRSLEVGCFGDFSNKEVHTV